MDEALKQRLEELDLDMGQIDALAAILSEQQSAATKEVRSKDIQLRIATDQDLAKKAPRAINALRSGAAELPAEMDDFDAWIEGYEGQLEKLGVPLPNSEAPTESSGESQDESWGAPMTGGGTPAGDSTVDSLTEAMEQGDVESIIRRLHELNRDTAKRGQIRDVVERFQDQRPIIAAG